MTPETSLSRVTYDTMLLSFKTNTMGPILVCQQFSHLLSAAQKHGASSEAPAVIANMSARVGSISDNELGGWYSYRCLLANLPCAMAMCIPSWTF
jgi:NAD(P)-dependent dehydrogenase (short-subunit alcohol dehydrogenase family)